MQEPSEPRFVFHGSAFALGGEITRPFTDVLEVQAATALPSVGGYGSARAEKFRYREIVSFDRAYSQVAGSSRHGVHETLVTATVEGLNILDMITADRVVGRLASAHGGGAQEDAVSLLPVGSYFVNLRIAGVPVNPRPHEVLMHKGKMSELEQEYRSADSPFVDRAGRSFRFPERKVAAEAALAETRPGGRQRRWEECTITTSIFHRIDVPHAPFVVDPGGGIAIEGFGRIVLGQFIVTRDSRRLTMIACQLGSPVEGTLSVVEPGGNGTPP